MKKGAVYSIQHCSMGKSIVGEENPNNHERSNEHKKQHNNSVRTLMPRLEI